MQAEGVIKYRLNLDQGPPPPSEVVAELAGIHDLCFKRKYVGQEGSVHFGNISKRLTESPLNKQSSETTWNIVFAITATQTSGLQPPLPAELFTTVHSVDLTTGTLYAVGHSKPSSEAMTHMALYVAQPSLTAVVHGHSPQVWHFCLETVMTLLKLRDPSMFLLFRQSSSTELSS
jgi:ribulose-5-phosphate 4-epimerase/fuculose-1-phosphate aldolase